MLSACGGGGHTTTGATVPRATTTTDPYAVPATIDIPYLNRVFVALDHINGEATRLIVAARRITPEAAELLHAVYADDEFKVQAEGWNNSIDAGLTTFRSVPGDRTTQVGHIRTVRPTCVALDATRDYNAIRSQPVAPSEALIALERHVADQLNPTPWRIASDLKSGTPKCE